MRCGMITVVLAMALVGSARGEYVGFAFTAVDSAGRPLSGRFSYELEAKPTIVSSGPFGSEADFRGMPSQPMAAVIEYEGREHIILAWYQPLFYEITLIDWAAGTGSDLFDLRFPEFGGPNSLVIRLADRDGSAFDTHLKLPERFNLDDFEERSVSFRPGTGVGVQATITSLTPGPVVLPEPPGLTLAGLGALGVGGLAWRRRRKVA